MVHEINFKESITMLMVHNKSDSDDSDHSEDSQEEILKKGKSIPETFVSTNAATLHKARQDRDFDTDKLGLAKQ